MESLSGEGLNKCSQREKSAKQKGHGNNPSILTHGLHHVNHVTFKDPVCHMSCGEGAQGFASLHLSGLVRFFDSKGYPKDRSFCHPFLIRYAGLTSTHLKGRMVGWGPGAILTLLDVQLIPLIHAKDPLDVTICKVIKGSDELVTAGKGNVCIWCLTHLVCRRRVVDGLDADIVFTHLALLPSMTQQGFRALATCGSAVFVVDLTKGNVVEIKKNLHLREIAAILYCPLQDFVVTASDSTIRVWRSDWELQMSFIGHTALVTSLALCPVSGLLISSSLDGTLRCWRPDIGDLVVIRSIPNEHPVPLVMGGPNAAGTFFSYSSNSVDFWMFNCLYNLNCRLDDLAGGPIHQIYIPPRPSPCPACVVCLHGNSNVTVVAAELGSVLARFQAKGRVKCADYCVPLEILLVLNEEGVITVANASTDPVQVVEEWDKIESWDWSGGQAGAKCGTVNCMVIYSDITDIQCGWGERRHVQMRRGCEPKKMKSSHETNRFLVILGHCGGCLTVLNMLTSKVQFRIAAHNDQNIISMQAYAERGNLLTAGEDNTVLVWHVSSRIKQYLSLHFSVLCDSPPMFLALMANHLTFTLEDQENGAHTLVQHNLETERKYTQRASEKHRSKITGLCACYHQRVFASSSEDGTVCIWDMENNLLRVLELNSLPESLGYCQESGDLLLGITGNLYRIPHEHLLHLESRGKEWEEQSESHKTWISSLRCRTNHGTENIPKINHPEFVPFMEKHKDLELLIKGEVDCKKKRRPTQQTKLDAFSNYLHLLHKKPPEIRDKLLEMASWLDKEEKEKEDLQVALIPESKWKRSQPIPPAIVKKVKCLPIIKKPETPVSPAEPITASTPPRTPPAPTLPPTPTPLPSSPSKIPLFLLQFVNEEWFQQIFSHPSCIPSSTSPREFTRLLCDLMVSCSLTQKHSILKALLMLMQQQVLDKETLCNSLHICLQSCIHECLLTEEQVFISELLKLMVNLCPNSSVTVVELLTMLAEHGSDLQVLAVCVLKGLGVEETELLCLEVESWMAQEEQFKRVREKAGHWLVVWTKKYKEHQKFKSLHVKGAQSFQSPVEVLKYFCSVKKENQMSVCDRTDAEMLPLNSSTELVQHPGETLSMHRVQNFKGRLLPPLHHRPKLMDFTSFLLLPMGHVTLSPFPFILDFRKFRQLSQLKYFSPESSNVEYYR